MKPFGKYDYENIVKAKQLLIDVYEYHYGYPGMSRYTKRLETIIRKLDTLANLEK